MRNFFNLIKTAAKAIDGFWIENAGHPIIILGREKTMPVTVYGFYDFNNFKKYLEVQLNEKILLEKLGKLPENGTLLFIEELNWIVINRNWIYNYFTGKHRIILVCQYHDSKDINDEE